MRTEQLDQEAGVNAVIEAMTVGLILIALKL